MNAPIPNEAALERARVRLDTSLKGKYRLDRVLGVGGMATVYAATHRNGKEFAIKVLHPELSVIGEIRSRFLREGYLANRVKHPGAVAVLDDDVTEDGSAFLVMELLHGENVESLWERHGHQLPLELVTGIGLQLLGVLDAAHRRGVVHRDIKPENLLLLSDGNVKVLDFGIARVRGAAMGHATEPGFTMGTPAFMAPEQALAELGEVDAQTDLWAVAATMFTLVSGEIVHGCGSSQQVLLRAATAKAPPLAQISSSAPRELCAVVDRGLAFSKADRWASAQAMHQALQAATFAMFGHVPGPDRVALVAHRLDDVSTFPPPSDEPSSMSTPSVPSDAGRTRGRLVGLGAIGTLILVAVALVFVWGRRTERDPKSAVKPSAVAGTDVKRPPPPAVGPTSRAPDPSASLTPVIQEVEADQLPPATASPTAVPIRPKTNPLSPAVAAPQAPALAPPKHLNCTPPYEFDSNGNKRWKRECL
jgi:serine/threonine-protein kinase